MNPHSLTTDVEVFPNKPPRRRAKNSPDIVKSSFIDYLKDGFPYKQSWQHPTTEVIYSYDYIHEKLAIYKKVCPVYFRTFWCLIITREKREVIAREFCYSSSTLKRMWDRAVSSVLFLMVFPDLNPDVLPIAYPAV